MPRVVRLPKLVLCSLALLALAESPAGAQQIQWRQDFNKARQEAKDKNLPLLMDIGTANCGWCKQLDATTFRDPAVIKLINDHFIPLRLDGQKYRSLTDLLHIEGYPTLVFATSQGKVVGMHEGYLKAPEFYGWTQQILAQVDPAPAGPKDNGIQLAAAQKVSATGDRTSQARALLALAEEEFRTQQYVACLMRCKTVTASFPELPEAAAARQLAQKVKSDPERLRIVCEGLTQSLCELYLDLAGSLLRAGQRDQARPYLQWITQACPNTSYATTAQQLLQSASPPAAVNVPLPGKEMP
jgi:thioredoxin-related protein